jgi:capsule polysaccharide modification protein KpsS
VAAFLAGFFDRHAVRLVALWNGEDHVGRLIVRQARRRGIPVVFFENGYFPGTLQADAQGVNSSSSLTFKPFETLRRELDTRVATAEAGASAGHYGVPPLPLLWRCLDSAGRYLDPWYRRRFPEQRGADWWQRRRVAKERRRIAQDDITLPPRFAFIPLQVHDDTQVLLNGRHFDTVEAFFEHACRSVAEHLGPDVRIVVKEHPEDLGRFDYSALRRRFPEVIWLRKYDIDRLLDAASWVVLINSSVGLQAIRRFKPTIVYGDSFYSRDEIAFCLHDLQDTAAVYQRARAGLTEDMRANIRFFMDYLERVYFFPGSWRKVDVACAQRAARRIVEAAALA